MRTLLVIDDNPSVLITLKMWFTHHGYSVVTAESGAEGLSVFGGVHIDAAIVDVHMPGMDGIQVCRALRNQAKATGSDLPVWLITGARTAEIEKLGLDAGALAVLTKPFDVAQLARQIAERFAG